MNHHQVDVFFYGSYINFAVLAEADIGDRPYQTACLRSYRLVIAPLANLEIDASSDTFGIVTKLTHGELDALYVGHAQEKLGGTYLPEAVNVFTEGNRTVVTPALCYRSHDMEPSTPDPAYVERILDPATKYKFPSHYLEHIASFK